MNTVDAVIIGAGVIGLAIAQELAVRFPDKDILLLEKNKKFGQEMSSRTSEVIHSGVYYPTGSWKAKLCVKGNRLLYEYCKQWDIPYRRLGKLIIARDEKDMDTLHFLYRQGQANGITDLEFVDAEGVRQLEKNVRAHAALLSPTSGIIDSHALMARLEHNAAASGAMLVYHQEVMGIEKGEDGYHIRFCNEAGTEDTIAAKWVINAAGHSSDQIAAMLGINIDEEGYRIYKCKGDYFAVNNEKSALVSRLVFPVSIRELKGTGIPVIKDINGRMRLGPDANYCPATVMNYQVNPAKAGQVLSVVSHYLPFLVQEDLEPDIAGLRPRLLVPCGSPPRDFIIVRETERGFPGVVNLIGVESPGMTCCLSLAAVVADYVGCGCE